MDYCYHYPLCCFARTVSAPVPELKFLAALIAWPNKEFHFHFFFLFLLAFQRKEPPTKIKDKAHLPGVTFCRWPPAQRVPGRWAFSPWLLSIAGLGGMCTKFGLPPCGRKRGGSETEPTSLGGLLTCHSRKIFFGNQEMKSWVDL